LKPPKVR